MSDAATGREVRATRGIAERSTGVWQLTADVNVARRLAAAGFDWLALDAQHGAIDRSSLVEMGRALGDVDANFVVRVPGVDPVWIGASLDAGAAAVIVPTIVSADDAAAAVTAAYYPPGGQRSWGPLSDLWGAAAPSPGTANELVQCIPMIETREALTDVSAIAAVEGVTALFLGPFDLSLALGTTVDELLAATGDDDPIPTIVRAAERQGKRVVAFAGDPARVPAFRAFGIGAVAVATDLALLDLGSRQVIAPS
jgi:4-hydroxy-2-oxoheptanedioate aldolase